VFDDSEPGTLFATEPEENTEVEAGSTVTLLVSAGFPEVAFDNDKDILRVHGGTGEKLDPVAESSAQEKDPAFSPDGTRVAYVRDGQVFLGDLDRPDAPAVELTDAGDELADLAWAPTADVNILAMGRIEGNDRDLCFGQIGGDGIEGGPQCIVEPDFSVGGAIHWAPNGKSILAFGVDNQDLGKFGIVRWTSKTPFSPNAADWGKGTFETDVSKPNEGVKDAAISPDGKRIAMVVKAGTGPFRLVIAKRNDFLLTNPRKTGVPACKVNWRPDGRELVLVQADAFCQEDVGSLVSVPLRDPSAQTQLGASGDNPVFQPKLPGG
jgi:dipeptidyl aminopeptidase/acylaminoacyl peptidase